MSIPMEPEPYPRRPRFPEREHYGCVNCGSTNHTTGDANWCPVEREHPGRVHEWDGDVCRLCGQRRWDEPPSISEALQEGRADRLWLTEDDLDLLRETIADALADLLNAFPLDIHDQRHYRSRFDRLVALGNKLGMNL